MDEIYSEKCKRYTIEELKSVLKYIDKEEFPERFELAKTELENRTIGKQIEYIHEPEPEGSESNLASPSDRLAASVVDEFIIGLPISIVAIIIYGVNGFLELAQKNSLSYLLIIVLISQSAYLIVNGRLLDKYGQTVGKQIMKIKIVNIQNDLPELYSSYGLRHFMPGLLRLIPFFGNLLLTIDVLFIFKEDRRCIHDHIAGTKVIKAV